MKGIPHPIIVYGLQSSKCLQEQGVCLSAVETNDLYLTLVSAANQYFIQCRKLWDQRLLVFASQQNLVKVDHFRFFLLIVF